MKYLGALLISVIVVGCGREDRTQKKQLKLEPDRSMSIAANDLVGTWSTGCVADPARVDIYMSRDFQFEETKVNRLTTYYAGSKCTTLLYQENLESEYHFNADGFYIEERKKVFITPFSAVSLVWMNQDLGFCKMSDWEVNEEKTIENAESCDIDHEVKIGMQLKKVSGSAIIELKECEKRYPLNCTVLEIRR